MLEVEAEVLSSDAQAPPTPRAGSMNLAGPIRIDPLWRFRKEAPVLTSTLGERIKDYRCYRTNQRHETPFSWLSHQRASRDIGDASFRRHG